MHEKKKKKKKKTNINKIAFNPGTCVLNIFRD